MIAFLKGKLASQDGGTVLVEVGGLGYQVQVPLSLLHLLPPTGEEIFLHTHLAVREDCLQLYGFSSREELDFFLKLLNVSGVGPRGALAVLSIYRPAELAGLIRGEDLTALTRVPGVGKKTAGRIVLELKDKISDKLPARADGEAAAGAEEDAVAALESLGYQPAVARKAVKEACSRFDAVPPAAGLVKACLSILAAQVK
ncbi:MAG: Holliday junction branch migration protein RuvA [Eubacteriales bacterium]